MRIGCTKEIALCERCDNLFSREKDISIEEQDRIFYHICLQCELESMTKIYNIIGDIYGKTRGKNDKATSH